MINQPKTSQNTVLSEGILILLLISWFRQNNGQNATQVITASLGNAEGANMSGGGSGNTGTGSSQSGRDDSDDQDKEGKEISNRSKSEKEMADKEIEKKDAGEGTILNNIGLKDSNPKVDPDDIDLSTGTYEADAATG